MNINNELIVMSKKKLQVTIAVHWKFKSQKLILIEKNDKTLIIKI